MIELRAGPICQISLSRWAGRYFRMYSLMPVHDGAVLGGFSSAAGKPHLSLRQFAIAHPHTLDHENRGEGYITNRAMPF
jgi:hypothetical protein